MPATARLIVQLLGQTRALDATSRDPPLALSAVLRQAELALNTRCGQRGLCDGCLVELIAGSLVHLEAGRRLSAADADGPLQACQYYLPDDGNAEIRIPARSLLAHEPQVVTSFSVNVSRAHDPLWQRVNLSGCAGAWWVAGAESSKPQGAGARVGDSAGASKTQPQPPRSPALTDSYGVELLTDEIDRDVPLAEAICAAIAKRRDRDLPVRSQPELARELADTGGLSVALEHQGDHWLVRPMARPREQRPFGLAVDVGTTTVVVLLVDLSTGEIANTASALNGQVRLGDNVLTRIQHCANDKAMVSRLQRAVVAMTLRPLMEQLLRETGVSAEQIASIVIAGNTTMLHLLAGVDPTSMGMAPFTPQFLEHRVLRANALPLRRRADGEHAPWMCDPAVHLLPGCAAYVGADVIAGVLSTGMVYQQETCLLVDVGTNGEIVLKHGDQMLGCATAAGPAFEGSGLGCGMRAGRGAISHIRLEDDLLHPQIEVIGDVEPIGLCGTAYVDFLAQARRAGLIALNGRFTPEAISHPRVRRGEHGREYTLATSPDGKPIYISELDVSRLLQAKGAIAAGIICLLRRVGMTSADVRTLYLAGGFGFHMHVDNVIRCGLLPSFRPDQIRLVGNTSLAGAYLALLDSSALAEIKAISTKVETVELNLDPNFESCYIDQLVAPE